MYDYCNWFIMHYLQFHRYVQYSHQHAFMVSCNFFTMADILVGKVTISASLKENSFLTISAPPFPTHQHKLESIKITGGWSGCGGEGGGRGHVPPKIFSEEDVPPKILWRKNKGEKNKEKKRKIKKNSNIVHRQKTNGSNPMSFRGGKPP